MDHRWGCLTILGAWCAVNGAAAQNLGDEQPVLRLRAGQVTLSPIKPTQQPPSLALGEGERAIVQFAGPLTSGQREALRTAGVRLEAYLPDHAYLADLSAAAPARLAALGFVRGVGRFQPAWKLDPRLAGLRGANGLLNPQALPGYRAQLDAARAALLDAGKVRVLISTFSGTGPEVASAELARLPGVEVGAGVVCGEGSIVDALVAVEALSGLADVPFVQFIEDAPRPTLRNNVTVFEVQSGTNADAPVWDRGLHGESQIIGLIDAPPYLTHCMFTDTEPIGPTHRKFVAFRVTNPWSPHSHGTHVAGTLAGDSGVWGTYDLYDGVAYAARISYSDFFAVNSAPATLQPRLIDAHDDGARVHSNSWGDDSTTAYTTWCRQVDQFSYDHEEDLVCFAATNLSLLRTPENAKNVLAVGASRQYPNQDQHSSGGQGPTFDGRRKPEVFTPGEGIRSASISTCSTTLSSGTSHACPSVAASATLVRQYFVEGFYPDGLSEAANTLAPSGALMKAVVLNAAVDMTGVAGYPSDVEGWGRLVLDRGLHFLGEQRGLIVRDVRNADGLATGHSYSFPITVWESAEDLRITLAFTDPPAVVGSAAPVINDLDLVVTGPDGGLGASTYRGNYFKDGQSAADGAADPLNNVEQVYLTVPDRGAYTIEVQATAVNGVDPQGFAVVITGQVFEGAYNPPPGFADHDADGDRDLADFAVFQRCFDAGGAAYVDPDCALFDADADGDVDLNDYPPFASLFTGPMQPAP